MSRHIAHRDDGTEIGYGFDAPTGGYWWNQVKDLEEEIEAENGLTLTQLKDAMARKFTMTIPIKELVSEFSNADFPTNLQRNVGIMFGKDIATMLADLSNDIADNFGGYLNK